MGHDAVTIQQDDLSAVLSCRHRIERELGRESLFSGNFDRALDVAPDGNHFLMIREESAGANVVAVPNWVTEQRRLTTTSQSR